MTKIKLCGLSRPSDIEWANELLPEYIGFVFAKGSKRCVSPEKAEHLRSMTDKRIMTVGVFVNETPELAASLVGRGIIDLVQLHGSEDEEYISKLRALTDAPIIKAFNISTLADVERAAESSADHILFDGKNAGSGNTFDHTLIKNVKRPYFLAGGLDPLNVKDAIGVLSPYAVDVSSGIETEGIKDREKMKLFVSAVREINYERKKSI